jgi:translation elongation factor EF-Tu-like GTPase
MPEQEVEGKLIGRVTHYFDKLQVAVIQLDQALSAGETIRIVGGETDFEQIIDSMEVDHEKINKAKKGDEIGIKVREKVRDGYRVYKI